MESILLAFIVNSSGRDILVSRDPTLKWMAESLAGLKADWMAESLVDSMAESLADQMAASLAESLAVQMTASLASFLCPNDCELGFELG